MLTNRGANVAHCSLEVSGSTSYSTDYTVHVENGALVMASLTPSAIAGSMSTLRTSCNIGKFQGVNDVLNVTDLSGDTSSNPAELTYYIISIWDAATATAPAFIADVFIEYDVVFHEPRKAGLD